MGILKTICDFAYKICAGIFSGLGLDKPISFLTDLFKTSLTFKGGMFDNNREKGDGLVKQLHRERVEAENMKTEEYRKFLEELKAER